MRFCHDTAPSSTLAIFVQPKSWIKPFVNTTPPPPYTVGVFHNHNPSNLDSSDQQIRLCCDLNLNLDFESVDLPLEVAQQIQIA